jgi:glyoxylase-like metal-dependent hydrolase (beta-lactamase superfamily II)
VRIADRWFDVTHGADGITMLREQHLHPVWQSNIWLVRGRERDLLIDSGMGIGDIASALQPLLERPLVAFATHRHADHIGGLHQFEDRVAHPLDAEAIANPPSASLVRDDYPRALIDFMESSGTPMGEFLIESLPYEGYDPRAYTVAPAPVGRLVEEGDVVDLGDRVFEVLHLPGHTPGSIGLWSAADGLLFSGDAIYDGPLYDFLPESSIPDYVATMRKLRSLRVNVVHGGHDPSFGRERMIQIIDEDLARRSGEA